MRLFMNLCAALILVAAPASAEDWAIVQEETRVEVDVEYLGSTVTMRFDTVVGEVRFDRRQPAQARAAVAVASADVETGLGFVNTFVRGPDWLNARGHPQITFRLDSLRQTSPSTAEVGGRMTFLGVTRPVDFQATVFRYEPSAADPDRFDAGFSLVGAVDRRDFGHTIALGQVPAILPVRVRLLMRSS